DVKRSVLPVLVELLTQRPMRRFEVSAWCETVRFLNQFLMAAQTKVPLKQVKSNIVHCRAGKRARRSKSATVCGCDNSDGSVSSIVSKKTKRISESAHFVCGRSLISWKWLKPYL